MTPNRFNRSPLARRVLLAQRGWASNTGRHGHRHNQQGFALMVVLFVILLTSLLVVALIGLSFSTAVFSGDQSVRDNRARAADVALQSTVNEIARDPTGNLGFPFQIDQSGQVQERTDCGNTGSFTAGDPHVEVYVECQPVSQEASQASGDGSVTGGLVGTDSRDLVRVIGSTNRGDQATKWKTAWPWSQTIVDNPNSSAVEQYSGAAQNAINAANATLLHRGSDPLSFTSSVEVSQGAAAMRDPALVNPDGFDSAINISGSYWQGLSGLLYGPSLVHPKTTSNQGDTAEDEAALGSYNDAELSNTCGLLQPTNANWRIWGAGIRTGNSLACSQDGSLRSATVTKEDGSQETVQIPLRDSLHLNWQTPGVIPPIPKATESDPNDVYKWAPLTWTPNEVQARAKTAPNCSGSPGANVVFEPGSYNREQTAKINSLWNGSCPGRTFLFNPGQYWMDVAPATPTGAAEENSLIINDPTARIIFGTPKANLSTASFPSACDPSQPGVLLTLSSRTSIRHKRGRLSMCGAQTQHGRQAIYQTSGGNVGWVALPSDDTTISSDFDSNPDGVKVDRDGLVAEAYWPCLSPMFQGESCRGLKHLTISGLGSDNDPGDAAISSVQVVMRADAPMADAPGSSIQFTVRPSAEHGGGQCSISFSPLPNNNVLYAYELMSPFGSCANFLKNRSQLVGASITAEFDLEPECNLLCLTGSAAIKVDYMSIRVPWSPTPTSVGNSVGSGYENPDLVTKLDGRYASRRVACDGWFFPWLLCDSNATGRIELRNLQDLSSPELTSTADASAKLTSLYVTVTGYGANLDLGSSSTTITVSRPNSSLVLCSARFNGIPGGDSIYGPKPQAYDLTKPATAGGNCNTQLTKASQLVGATVSVTSTLRKSSDCSVILTWLGIRDCSGWGAYIDHIGVSATSAVTAPGGQPSYETTYSGPKAPFLVTSNFAAGQSNDATFNVDGQVSIPRADLDIHWDGPLPIGVAGLPSAGSVAVDPLFGGAGNFALTVNSINSSGAGKVGVVCCKPAKPTERQVELTVHLGSSAAGKVIATAKVLFFDVSTSPESAGTWAPGQRVTIQDWRMCPSGVDSAAACSSA